MNHFDRLRTLAGEDYDIESDVAWADVARAQGLWGSLRSTTAGRNRPLVVFRSAFSDSVQQILHNPTFGRLRHSLDDDLSMSRLAETPAFIRLASLWATATDPATGGSAMKRLFDDAVADFGGLPSTRDALRRVIAHAKGPKLRA